MDRKEFLTLTGMSLGAFVLATCGVGCKKEEEETASKNFTLDLNASANAALKTNGGSIVNDGVIVARTNSGNYIAVAAACTHQGTTINYEAANSRFKCPNHGAVFNESGGVVSGPAGKALTQYKTELNGTSLRVFS